MQNFYKRNCPGADAMQLYITEWFYLRVLTKSNKLILLFFILVNQPCRSCRKKNKVYDFITVLQLANQLFCYKFTLHTAGCCYLH